ncbi:uncharacterized protein LTR77_001648 [Saxophila tyrrhenica]|uniref:Uncharacterized protein n=1 Tax=Saxophila tyrrhenica TaxID=1690608 RepID=A0AAV9PQG6_9PEZI|nr:hypothetical protein LTR77_001648 [Saxophila tyrrhenica]
METTPPAGNQRTNDEVVKDATKLIALLDRYSVLRGDTLTTCPDITPILVQNTEEAMGNIKPGIPAALQIYPIVPLSSHLDELDAERAEMSRIRSGLRVLMTKDEVKSAAKKIIMDEYARLIQPKDVMEKFEKKETTIMLLQLRHEQAKEKEPKIEEFSFELIEGLLKDGKVSRVWTYWLEKNTSWDGFLSFLTKASVSGFAEARGHPRGYSLKDGKWLYSLMNAQYVQQGNHHDLATTEDYRAMRSHIDSGKWACILIMHELVWQEARVKQAMPVKDGLELDGVFLSGWDEFANVNFHL